MRLFADDWVPNLMLGAGSVPWPATLPSSAGRRHRDRLVALLARALRGADPELRLLQIRWLERDCLDQGRLRPRRSSLIWWRVAAFPAVDPAEVIRECLRLSPGLMVFDFDRPPAAEHLGWLGALKLVLLQSLTAALLRDPCLSEAKEVIRQANELASLAQSPIELLDFTTTLAESLIQGLHLPIGRHQAIGKLIAGRVAERCPEQRADDFIKALMDSKQPGPLPSDGRSVLEELGLSRDGVSTPLAALLDEGDTFRRILIGIADSCKLSKPLSELAPGWVEPPEAEDFRLPMMGRELFFTELNRDEYIEETLAALPSLTPTVPLLQRAAGVLEQDPIAAADLALTAEKRDTQDWTSDDFHLAGLAYLAFALHLTRRGFWNTPETQRERGLAWYRAAAEAFEQAGQYAAAARALIAVGDIFRTLNDRVAAEAILTHALELAQRSGEDEPLARTHKAICRLCLFGRDYQGARGACDEALRLYSRIMNTRGEADMLILRGRLNTLDGKLEAGKSDLHQSLELFEQIADRPGQSDAHGLLGLLHLRGSNIKKAEKEFLLALETTKETGDSVDHAFFHWQLGNCRLQIFDFDGARSYYDYSLNLLQEIDGRPCMARVLLARGDLNLLQRDTKAADSDYAAAQAIFEQIGDLEGKARVERSRAKLVGLLSQSGRFA
jgi:tetratricopeptide (TPR) repeat protein